MGLLKSATQTLIKAVAPNEKYLFSPLTDFAMAGGGALILYLIILIFIPKTANTNLWGWGVYYAGFLVNFPHFATSYQIMYGSTVGKIAPTKENIAFRVRAIWAAYVVPCVLFVIGIFVLAQSSMGAAGWLVNAMYFFVGWHYIKQIFGVVVVLSSVRKIYFTKVERYITLAPLYLIWIMSFVNANLASGQGVFYGVRYAIFDISKDILSAVNALLFVSTIVLVGMLVRKWIHYRQRLPLAAYAALAAIYVWYIPRFSHPFYFYIIPFFHSMQYLLFVVSYKRGESIEGEVDKAANFEPQAKNEYLRLLTYVGGFMFLIVPPLLITLSMKRHSRTSLESMLQMWFGPLSSIQPSAWILTVCIAIGAVALYSLIRVNRTKSCVSRFLEFFMSAFLLGALGFSIIPAVLDILARRSLLPGIFSYNTQIFGTSFYLFLFTVFINIHHYFIDNVLWKKDNPNVRRYLLSTKQPK